MRIFNFTVFYRSCTNTYEMKLPALNYSHSPSQEWAANGMKTLFSTGSCLIARLNLFFVFILNVNWAARELARSTDSHTNVCSQKYNGAYGWSNKPPPRARTIPSRFFQYRWVSQASKEGALSKKSILSTYVGICILFIQQTLSSCR